MAGEALVFLVLAHLFMESGNKTSLKEITILWASLLAHNIKIDLELNVNTSLSPKHYNTYSLAELDDLHGS